MAEWSARDTTGLIVILCLVIAVTIFIKYLWPLVQMINLQWPERYTQAKAAKKIQPEAHDAPRLKRDAGRDSLCYKLLVLLRLAKREPPGNNHNNRIMSPLDNIRLGGNSCFCSCGALPLLRSRPQNTAPLLRRRMSNNCPFGLVVAVVSVALVLFALPPQNTAPFCVVA